MAYAISRKWLLSEMRPFHRVNPASHDNWCIKRAARHGHDEVVKVLLADTRVDPTTEDNFAIREVSFILVIPFKSNDGNALSFDDIGFKTWL